MSALISDKNSIEKCSTKIMDPVEPKECTKNGLVNGLMYKKHKVTENNNRESVNIHTELISDIKNLQNHKEESQELDASQNKVGKSKKRTKKKKCNTTPSSSSSSSTSTALLLNGPNNKLDEIHNLLESITDNNSEKKKIEQEIPSSSIVTNNTDDVDIVTNNTLANDLKSLILNDNNDIINNLTVHHQLDKTELLLSSSQKKIDFVPYESELQMPMIMKIIQKDLSEPYSIYTYRYFIHNWPKLCFLAMNDGQCVGAIVCKLDLHRKVVRRGYIAMLAVDQNYRKLKIGSTLVQMAIHEMTNGDADEVVLETEVTNKPALKLYEKLGFVRDKRLFRYYLNGVDALRLKLWLR